MELKAQYKIFVEEYVKCLNATKAAILAGYSENGAGVHGHRLLKNPKIQAEINRYISERSKNTAVTVENILSEVAKIAFTEYGEKTGDRLKALELLGKKFGIWDGISGESAGKDRRSGLERILGAIARHSGTQ